MVQFSASELDEDSSYDHLKVEKVKIRILRRRHLLGSIECIDSLDSRESEDYTGSIDSIDFKASIDSKLVPHKRPPTFTPRTKGK